MMPHPRVPEWRTLAIIVGALLAVIVVAGLLFIWSGVYNVAASKGHLAVTRWIIETTLRRSVETHSLRTAVPPLADGDLVRLGAGHFASGCAPCHGAPGQPRNPIVRSMLPPPPALSQTVRNWSPEELFWIVRNGFKYTGMPAWAAQERDDEVWAVVAFLQKLPDLKPGEYRELTSSGRGPEIGMTSGLASMAGAVPGMTCARCHDTADTPVKSRLVPRLAGQQEAYLRRALEEYASGKRASGIMQPVAGALDAADMGKLAAYYSSLSADSATAPPAPDRESVERGRAIAGKGIPARGIPPCLACHSGRASETFPLLAGQSGEYLAGQLRVWQRGVRDDTAHGAIMSAIARRLTEEEIRDAAAFFEAASSDGIAPETEPAVGSIGQ